jgi:UDP-glucose 4-epimerase
VARSRCAGRVSRDHGLVVTGRILVTGGSGFLGSATIAAAGRVGLSAQPVGRRASGQLRLHDAAEAGAGFITAIVHACGRPSVSESFDSPHLDLSATVGSLLQVLEYIRNSTPNSRLVLLSSAAVYGQPRHLPVDEFNELRPVSPYGYHKRMAEQLAEEYVACFGIKAVSARLFSVVGQAQRRLLPWEIFEQAAGDSSMVSLRGTGNESRDFCYVDDVADAIVGLVSVPLKASSWLPVNVASGKEVTVRELVEMVLKVQKSNKSVEYRCESTPGDPPRWRADIHRVQELLPHWIPRSLKSALVLCAPEWQRWLDDVEVRDFGLRRTADPEGPPGLRQS